MYPARLHISSKRKRMVHRNKVIIVGVAVMIIACLTIFYGSRMVKAQDSDMNLQKAYYKSIEIKKGDTLWELAESYSNQNEETIKDYIHKIKELNNLDTNTLLEGQCLTIVYYSTDSGQLASR